MQDAALRLPVRNLRTVPRLATDEPVGRGRRLPVMRRSGETSRGIAVPAVRQPECPDRARAQRAERRGAARDAPRGVARGAGRARARAFPPRGAPPTPPWRRRPRTEHVPPVDARPRPLTLPS